MKIDIKAWQKKAERDYYEAAYRKISQAILHNKILVKRLMTEEGAKMVGKEKATKEMVDAQMFIEDQEKELLFLIKIINDLETPEK